MEEVARNSKSEGIMGSASFMIIRSNNYMIGVYKISNIINNKVYIGQSVDIQRRFSEHIRMLDNKCHYNKHLQASYNKYGKDVFLYEVLCVCDATELDAIEVFFINYYNSMNSECGYNKESGGSINKSVSTETREKQRINNSGSRNPFYGKKHTKEHIEKIRELSSLHRHSEATKQKISENHADISGQNNPRSRSIYCSELNEYFWGAQAAEDKYGISRNNICSCLKGRLKSAGKHPVTKEKLTWVYTNDTQQND